MSVYDLRALFVENSFCEYCQLYPYSGFLSHGLGTSPRQFGLRSSRIAAKGRSSK